MPSGWEWAILVVIALLLFGGARLSGVGRDVGRAVRDFGHELNPGSSAPQASEAGSAATAAVADPHSDAPHTREESA